MLSLGFPPPQIHHNLWLPTMNPDVIQKTNKKHTKPLRYLLIVNLGAKALKYTSEMFFYSKQNNAKINCLWLRNVQRAARS